MIKAYKIVFITPKGIMRSAFARNKLEVHYKLGKLHNTEFPCFFFGTRAEAEEKLNSYIHGLIGKFAILECDIEPYEDMKLKGPNGFTYIPYISNYKEAKRFWEIGAAKSFYKTQEDIIISNKFIPLRVVKLVINYK